MAMVFTSSETYLLFLPESAVSRGKVPQVIAWPALFGRFWEYPIDSDLHRSGAHISA
jgi:hypothetical protein